MYDVFISYRRQENNGTSNVTLDRSIKLELEKRHYKVFFDYSECTDDYFSEKILPAIRTCKFFILVLTKDCLTRCVNKTDWVRREIKEAIDYGRKIIPITPDNACTEWTKLPVPLKKLNGLHITTIYTDHMFEASFDFVINNRFNNVVLEQKQGADNNVSCADAVFVNNTLSKQKDMKQNMMSVNDNKKEPEIFVPDKIINHTETFTVNGVSFDMVFVKGCHYDISITKNKNTNDNNHNDGIIKDFYIGKFPVTQKLWEAIMEENNSFFKGKDLPVENISWNDCDEFLKKLNIITKKSFRLPTENEWEYAARGGNRSGGYKFSGSNIITDVAWCINNSNGKTHPVGTKQPNELGIYDMSGNVWEWCNNKVDHRNTNLNEDALSSQYYLLCGGSWQDYAGNCQVFSRYKGYCNSKNSCRGLRLILVP